MKIPGLESGGLVPLYGRATPPHTPGTSVGIQNSTATGWHSTIGIVTAIIGNILISFALNIQRYAHLRLEREQGRRRPASLRQKSRSGSSRALDGNPDYGTNSNHREQDTKASSSLKKLIDGDTNLQASTNGYSGSHEHRAEESESGPEKDALEEGERNYLHSPYWWAGISMMILGEAGNFIAYGFAPASIVSPLGVVALVSNCLIAPFMLRERFRQRDFWGVAVAIAGAVTVVLSAKNSNPKLGPHDVWGAITRWEFEVYLGVTCSLILLGVWASEKYGERNLLFDLSLVGLFGGYTALSTKGVASLLSYKLWHILTFPITYLLVAVLVSTALLQIRYLNRALQRFDSTEVIPTQFVLFTISVIVGSAVLYRDFEETNAARATKFIGGCLLTFLGVYLITSHRVRDEDEYDAEDEEEQTAGQIAEETEQLDGSISDPDSRGRIIPKVKVMNAGTGSISRQRSFDSLDEQRALLRTPDMDSPDSLTKFASRSTAPEIPVIESGSPLLENPWLSTENLDPHSGSRAPILESSTSSPLLPVDSRRSGHDRTSQHAENLLRKGSTPSRTTVLRMLPGPYVSPLSSSLSGIVADSRRRSVINSPAARKGQSMRGPSDAQSMRSSLRRSRFVASEGDLDPGTFEPSLHAEEGASQESLEHVSSHGRPRSKSAISSLTRGLGSTFTDLLAKRRGRKSTGKDPESGPV